MSNNKSKKDQISKLEIDRIIIELLHESDFKTQQSVIDALKERNIEISQSTLSRSFKDRQIKPSPKNGAYKVTTDTHIQFHKDELHALMKKKSPTLYRNISVQLLKTEKGNASLYAFHLEQAFPGVLIDVTIGPESLLMYINMDADTDSFFEFMKEMSDK